MARLSADCLFGLRGRLVVRSAEGGVGLGGGAEVLGGALLGWVWLVLVSSRAGIWASFPRVGSGWLVGRLGGSLVGGGWAFLVFVHVFFLVFTVSTFDPGP